MKAYRILAAVVVACWLISPVPVSAQQGNTSETYRQLNLFGEVFERVRSDYVEDVTDKKLIEDAINGMLSALDPHSSYMNARAFQDTQIQTRGEFGGLGIEVTMENGLVKVVSPIDETPASRAGLKPGALTVERDGEPVMGLTLQDAVERMRGPVNSQIKLTIRRGTTEPFVVTLQRAKITIQSVRSSVEGDIGYVRITSFTEQTETGLRTAIQKIKDQLGNKTKGLVLDLRNNPGGFLDQAIHVAEVFLRNGQLILTQKGRNGFRDNTYESRNNAPDMTPLVILINENTASASEIVAGAMQDHDRALIVGQTSFGKGLVQSIIPLEYGAGLTLTSAKYYTPSGRLIQRDYSNGGFYDYYTHGAGIGREPKEPTKPTGQESKTDTGRAVYSGGGISPDESVGPRTVSLTQRRLLSPAFAFTRELVNGRIRGFESNKIGNINFRRELQPEEFKVTDAMFKAFRDFATADPAYKLTAAIIDRNRSFIELELRFNMVTAAYGRVMGDRVFVTMDDPQVAKAVDVLPKARDLAQGTAEQKVRQ